MVTGKYRSVRSKVNTGLEKPFPHQAEHGNQTTQVERIPTNEIYCETKTNDKTYQIDSRTKTQETEAYFHRVDKEKVIEKQHTDKEKSADKPKKGVLVDLSQDLTTNVPVNTQSTVQTATVESNVQTESPKHKKNVRIDIPNDNKGISNDKRAKL